MENDFFESYQTSEWQRKKNAVLERDDYTCQICGSKNGLMQVHHITYKHCKGKAYNAPMGDLITLCERCHANDDGDHKHFFDGKVTLTSGCFGKPHVSDFRKADWIYGIDVIIAIKLYDYDWWSIGFREIDNWFPKLLGVKSPNNLWVEDEFLPSDVSAQRLATDDEVERLIKSVGGKFGDFVTKGQDYWFVHNGFVPQARIPENKSRKIRPSEIVLRSRSNPKIMVNVPTINQRIMVKMPNDMK